MSDGAANLAVGVILRADGSGLVGQANLSADAIDKLATSTRGAAGAARQLTDATKAYGSIYTSNWWQDEASRIDEATRASKANSKAANDNARAMGAMRAGWQQAGFQVQDMIVQAQMGTSAFVIMGQQLPQLAQAFALMGQNADGTKGKFAAFTSFLAGPMGVATTLAVTVAAALASAYFSSGDAADDARASTIDFSSSLRAAAGLVSDYTAEIAALEQATRGLINTQALLVDNSRQFAQTSISQLTVQMGAIDREIAERSKVSSVTDFLFGANQNKIQLLQLEKQRAEVSGQLDIARRSLASAQTAFEARQANESADPKGAARAQIERDRARLLERRRATLEQGAVPLADSPIESISGDDFNRQMSALQRRENALNETRKKDTSARDAAKAARETERLADFGDRAAESIARINDQFNAAPKEVDRARQATAQLDAIIADLQQRKPPNFEALIEQAKAIKPLIEDSLTRPIRDMLADQEQQIALGEAQLSGRQSEAEALQLTYQLMAMMGVESKDQLATELAKRGVTGDQVRQLYDNLNIMRQQTREMEAQRAEQQAYLSALDAVQDSIRQTLADLRTRGPKAIGDLFKDLLTTADTLFADVVSEQLFGDLFRDLKDEVTGADKVSRAGEKMADAVDDATTSIDRLATATQAAVDKIMGTVTGSGTSSSVLPSTPAGIGETTIEVTARRLKDTFREGYEGVFKDFKSGIKSVFSDIFGDRGLFSASLAKSLGAGLANAQIGSMVGSGITSALGLGGSSTGGAIGGALGGALGGEVLGALGSFAGPVGTLVGGVLGSVVGGLFKTSRSAGATLTGADSISIGGKDKGNYGVADGLAGSVLSGLEQIAEAFGGTVGSFNTTIGVRGGDYRVNTTGTSLKTKNGAVDFNDDEAGAIAYAIADAVADGAIDGVSAQVAAALKSSPDLNEAIQEALKVREVEQLLGGIGAEMEESFRQFEAQAKERLRIATQYGFDVVEIEKRNAEDRAALVDEILSQRVGSLQSLLDDLKYGDLFEGSAADQRQALLVEIAKAQQEAMAGKDGAADTLADLNRRLVELSREAFGTAGGEYASDRAGAISSAQAVIDAENARIKAAQDATAATNEKLDEANELSAEANSYLALIAQRMGLLQGSGSAIDYAAILRGAV